VGLVPEAALLAAGSHYLHRMHRSRGVPKADVLHAAVRSLGLAEVAPFEIEHKVIEAILARERPLASMSVQEFADETSRDSAAPGGGSVAAVAGALAAGLASMVANLPHPKSKWKDVRDDLEQVAIRAQTLKQQLLDAVDDDTWAFEQLMAANRASGPDAPERVRAATLEAARVPLTVAEACPEIVELCSRAAELGMRASASDAGVGAVMARACVVGAAMNVRINLADIEGDPEAADMLRRAREAVESTRERADALEAETWRRLGVAELAP
jgi:glutamate formiminotransferase/formiminotetrahydrofolate cyclodeaminase